MNLNIYYYPKQQWYVTQCSVVRVVSVRDLSQLLKAAVLV